MVSLIPYYKETLFESKLSPREFKEKLATYVRPSEKTLWTDTQDRAYQGDIFEDSFKIQFFKQISIVEGKIIPKNAGSIIKMRIKLIPATTAIGLTFTYSFLILGIVVVVGSVVTSHLNNRPFSPSIKGTLILFSPFILNYLILIANLRRAFKWNLVFFNKHLKE